MTRRPGPRAALATLALVLVALPTAPAAADAPRPTNFRSTVTDITPELPPGAEVRILGGDSLLELSLPPGHTAAVPDYPASDDVEPVPYLRFDADGTVRRNAHAVATTANEARYGTSSTVPDPDAEPRWEVVATDGTYAWHDHRIHWMSPRAPRTVAEDGQVDLGGVDGGWTVPLTVDGRATVITGELVVVDAPSAAGWLVAVFAAAAVVAAGLRFGSRVAAALGAASAAGAVVVATATWQAVPPGAGASPIPVAVAATALVAGLLAALGPARSRLVAVAATAAALFGWGATRWAVLTHSILPTSLAPWLDRVVTAAAIGAGLGLAGLLVKGPVKSATEASDQAITS